MSIDFSAGVEEIQTSPLDSTARDAPHQLKSTHAFKVALKPIRTTLNIFPFSVRIRMVCDPCYAYPRCTHIE